MSEIEQVNGLEQEFNKLNTESMKMNGQHNGDLNMDQVTSDSIGNSLDASPVSAASASSDSASTTSSNTGNIIEANVANLIEDDTVESKEDVIEDNVIEANVQNIIEDNKSDISEESTKIEEKVEVKPKEDNYSYDSVFPSLPNTGTNFTDNNVWNNIDSKLTLSKRQNLTVTQVFHVPVEERRYKDVANFGNENSKKSHEIADRLGVKVEICCSKDSSLHIIVTGPEEKVIEAKRSIVNELVKEAEHQIRVPKEQHKFLIGKSGIVLRELQEKTCTSIHVPKSDANSENITITGPRDGIEQAIHEIQIICDEQSKTGFERLDIPKLYHPWIRGFNNEIANEIASRTGAKINIPPPQIEKDEIAVSGEKEKVDQACMEIQRIYKNKSKVTKLAIQITKSQHKLIIGKNGSTVQEIFKDYDVYVQVPKLESTSETIYLYGEETKLGAALSMVCAKANSIVNIKIEVASWLHRYLIGEKGSNISKITADYPATHVKFEPDNNITLDGPPEEVEMVKQRLELIVAGLKKSMVCEEMKVDPKYYSQIVGKKYDNITRLNKEHGVNIRVPSASDQSNVIRIEGAPDGVKKAKKEFVELVKKVENERSKDIIIEQKYHSNLIGKNGKNLSEIRAKFNEIQIQIPNQEEKSEVVTIRGNNVDVNNCYNYLQKTVREMQENSYQDSIQIFKQFHRMLIGKSGIFIRKIREETNTHIEVPAEDSDSDSITIIGRQENVRKARALIEEKVKELVKVEEDFVEIAHSLHTALIGRGGAIIKQIRKDCGGVIINFPESSNSTIDKIILRGPREEIEKAKKELVKLAKEKNEISYSEDVPAKLEYHRFLVGRNGNNVNTLRDQYNVRIIFPSSMKDNNNNKNTKEQSQDLITIIGSESNVKAVRTEIEKTLKNLEEQVTDEVNVDQKWHKNFTAKRAKLINKISDDNCNVKISFPKGDSDIVVLKGPKDAIVSAKKQILEIVYDLENHVSIELAINQKYHVSLIGKKGINSSQISEQFNVELQFPAKFINEENSLTNGDHQYENGNDGDSSIPVSPSKSDIIVISGLKENCENAREALLALVPTSEDFDFPQKFHKHLLENKAEVLRDLSNQYNIQINVPKKGNDCEHVTLVGTRENINEAKPGLKEKLEEFELNNFQVEIIDFDPELIPQLRGRQGIEVIKLEKKFQVRIDFSRKGEPDKITIKGLQENVKKCENFIQQKITDEDNKTSQEISIDNRVHSRIIGKNGKAIAKIMEKFKVDVKFNRSSDVVVVKGSNNDAVEDACDHLKNLEEEYLQDVTERDAYRHPSALNEENGHGKTNGNSNGFVVSGAPWEAQASNKKGARNGPAPDTSNMDLFPTMITATVNGVEAQGQKASWGPRR